MLWQRQHSGTPQLPSLTPHRGPTALLILRNEASLFGNGMSLWSSRRHHGQQSNGLVRAQSFWCSFLFSCHGRVTPMSPEELQPLWDLQAMSAMTSTEKLRRFLPHEKDPERFLQNNWEIKHIQNSACSPALELQVTLISHSFFVKWMWESRENES